MAASNEKDILPKFNGTKPKLIKRNGPYRQGLFVLNNPHKYLGDDIDNIIYRSSWEKRVFKFLDDDDRILAWASEPFPISYMKPVVLRGKATLKLSKYYPDVYVEFVDANKKLRRQLIEIKPEKQTKASTSRKPKVKLLENAMYAVNTAKWHAAESWCKQNNIEFIVATEKSLFR